MQGVFTATALEIAPPLPTNRNHQCKKVWLLTVATEDLVTHFNKA